MKSFFSLLDRTHFRLFFLIVVFLNTLQLAYFDLGQNPLYPLVFIWSFGLFCYDLYHRNYRQSHMFLLLLYGLLLLVATILHQENQSSQSLMMAILQLIIFLQIFMNPKAFSFAQLRKEFHHVLVIVCILTFVASGASIVLFFGNVSLSHNGAYVGLVNNRLYGVYFNCNPAAFLSCMSFLLSIWAYTRRYALRMFYACNAVLQLLYIILTGCRSAVLILAFYAVLFLWQTLYQRKRYGRIKKGLLSFCTVLGILIGSSSLHKTMLLIPQAQGAGIVAENRFRFDDLQKTIGLLIQDPLHNMEPALELVNDISSGRIELFYDSIAIWKTSPILGIGAGTFRNIGLQVDPDSVVLQGTQVVHAHNLFMEALVTCGILGFAIFGVFCYQMVRAGICAWKTYRHTKWHAFVSLCLMLVLTEVIGSMFDYGVFYVYSLSATLCWLFLGYLFWLSKQQDQEEERSKLLSYDLYHIDYVRMRSDVLQAIDLEVVNVQWYPKQQLGKMELGIQLRFMDHISVFTYIGTYQLLTGFDAGNKQHLQQMARQLYQEVSQTIQTMTDDSRGTLVMRDDAVVVIPKHILEKTAMQKEQNYETAY